MLTLAVDNLAERYQNMTPLHFQGHVLTETVWLMRWMDHYNIEYNTVKVQHATPETWYPVAINFWHFEFDYLQALPDSVKQKLIRNEIRVLFLYREADDPARIMRHIDQMCQTHGFDPECFVLVSGNTLADRVPGSRFFWFFDVDLYFRNLNTATLAVNTQPRTHNVTCLSRVHKSWREWFVYNLYRLPQRRHNFLSYGNVVDQDLNDFEIWTSDNLRARLPQQVRKIAASLLPPDDHWRCRLPLRADDLDGDQHNDHATLVPQHFQQSYWNIVLETLLDTEVSGGVFVTEKTLKPVRNGQSFLVLGCQHSLEFIRHKGYKTFANAIDESYDDISSVHDRWYAVFSLARSLAQADTSLMQTLQRRCLEAIQHNQQHFSRDRRPEIMDLVRWLQSI